MARSDVTLPGLSMSDRQRVGQLLRLYRVVHGRQADPSGLTGALHALRGGTPLGQLVGNALDSPEFAHGPEPRPASRGDVDRLFERRCGRPPLGPGEPAAFVSAEEYLARVIAWEETRDPTSLTAFFYQDGLDPGNAQGYQAWLAEHDRPPDNPQPAAREHPDDAVLLSCVVVGREHDLVSLDALAASLRAQSRRDFEIVVAGSRRSCDRMARHGLANLRTLVSQADPATDLDLALATCRGLFACVLGAGWVLAPDAVSRVGSAIDGARITPVALFADGDVVDRRGRRSAPDFAAGWDAERALCTPEWGSRLMLRTQRARDVGGARPACHPYAWEDLALRVMRADPDEGVQHIAWPLFSRLHRPLKDRLRDAWTTRSRQAGWRRLVADHLAAQPGADAGRGAVLRQSGPVPLRVAYPVPRAAPLVCVIIPTRDRADLLAACLDGLLERTDYPKIEVVVIDNASAEPAAHACLMRYGQRANVRVLHYDAAFNWAAINNVGVAASRGEVLLFLNNDTEVIEPGWLTELVSQAMRDGVGAVGGKLLYRDRTVQHAGLIFGPGARSYHRFRHMPGDAPGYRNELAMVREVSAVTGACLAMRRAVFDEAGGMEEHGLRVTWSDTDLCFRVRSLGYRVICTPFARLLHLEQATRGVDDTPERMARAQQEREFMLRRWPHLSGEDPHFSPNLHLGEHDTRLAGAPRRL